MERYFVTGEPLHPRRRLHQGRSIAACLDWIRDHWDAAGGKPAIWVDHPTRVEGPDAFLCIPARSLDGWRDRAAEIVEAWEARWLLIASAPRAHREEAMADLVEAVTNALTTAARSDPSDDGEDVGF